MANVQPITGYVHIPNHPRGASDYKDNGAHLATVVSEAGYEMPVYVTDVEGCWLDEYRMAQGRAYNVAVGDNPAKNTAAYHAVQHQKFEFLACAYDQFPSADVFVWIDYGIFHIRDIASQPFVVPEFLYRVRDTGKVEAPGCWHNDCAIVNDYPCWRFCGGLWVVPRQLVHPLYNAVVYEAAMHMEKPGTITWEVNTLARVEARFPNLFRWYQADHDHTMFTGY